MANTIYQKIFSVGKHASYIVMALAIIAWIVILVMMLFQNSNTNSTTWCSSIGIILLIGLLLLLVKRSTLENKGGQIFALIRPVSDIVMLGVVACLIAIFLIISYALGAWGLALCGVPLIILFVLLVSFTLLVPFGEWLKSKVEEDKKRRDEEEREINRKKSEEARLKQEEELKRAEMKRKILEEEERAEQINREKQRREREQRKNEEKRRQEHERNEQRNKEENAWNKNRRQQNAEYFYSNDYHIFGLPRTATFEDFKNKYKLLARMYHPDKHEGSSDAMYAEANRKMVELNGAWEKIKVRFGKS